VRLLHGVCVEELIRQREFTTHNVLDAYFGLGFASVAAFPIPPFRTIAVNDVTSSAVDGHVGTRNGDQRTYPFFVGEGSRALEGNLRPISRCLLPANKDLQSFHLSIQLDQELFQQEQSCLE
jgi:hypothetical protein